MGFSPTPQAHGFPHWNLFISTPIRVEGFLSLPLANRDTSGLGGNV